MAQYKKYDPEDVERIFRVIRKANDGNFEEVELEDKNRRFRLENRKVKCIKELLEEKEMKFRQPSRSNSLALLPSKTLPPIDSKAKIITSRPKMTSTLTPALSPALSSHPSSSPGKLRRILLLKGKITNKEDIFSTIGYFKSLSGNKGEIRPKEFIQGFEKKIFLKKQVASLFQFFDRRKRGEVSL